MSAVPWVSKRKFAELDGCDEALVRRAVRQKRLVTDADGNLDPALAKTGWRKNNRRALDADQRQAGADGSARPDQPSAESAKAHIKELAAAAGVDLSMSILEAERYKVIFDGQLKRLDYDIKSAKVVPVDLVREAVAKEYAKVRTRLLAIPAEQSPWLHRLKTVNEVQDALSKVIHEALEELAYDGAKRT